MMKLTDNLIIKKLLIIFIFASIFFISVSFFSSSFAADFIVPNSSGEPVTIDISGLDLIPDIEVTIGNFPIQPRPYRTSDTKILVVFPLPLSSSEKTLIVKAGNSSISKTISFRASQTGILKNSLLPDLEKARSGNSITKISDGRVVLIGGSKTLADEPLNSIEIFDPETGKSELLKSPNGLKSSALQVFRSQHTATYLGITNSPLGMIIGPVEQILVIGGFSQNGVLEDSIEIVEIKVGTLQGTSTLLTSKKAKLNKARIFHTASLLPNGTVLIAGGQGRISMAALGAINSIELFDPITRTIQSSGISLDTPRLLHTATTLQNGNILIAGGFTNDKQDEFGFGKATETAELVNVSNLSIKKVGTLINKEGIGGHSAVLLTNGLVLITGGSSDFFSSRTKDDLKGVTRSTVQFYDPSSEAFNPLLSKSGGNQSLEISRFLHQSVLLPNGNVAIVGGLNIKAGGSATSLISTPISTIEIFNPDLLTFSVSLKADKLPSLETATGRILPSAILVTPKSKTYGLLSASDSNTLINCAVYVTGGFTNGLGRLPSKTSELIQIESAATIEGRKILLSPDALIRGSYLSELLVNLDKFSKVPSVKVEPQTVNLSNSNSFMANIKALTSNNEIVLLKAETTDPNNSVIISPSLFQVGENITVNRKDNSVQGQFELTILPADATKDFIGAKVKVNIADSSKPFLSTVPGFGVSLGTQSPDNSDKVQVKVFSQDGTTELTSIPSNTQVTATVTNPQILNLGGTGISSIVGTLATQFSLNAIKPGSTSVNFTINFPDVLPVAIPVEITGTPSFSTAPIDTTILTTLLNSGVEVSNVTKLSPTIVSLEDIRLSTSNKLFPLYVPINLLSSVDNSHIVGLFTLRPIFGIDLLNALPRTLVNVQGIAFKSPLSSEPTAIGGIVLDDKTQKPLAFLAASDGIRSFTYEESVSKNLDGALVMINGLTDVKALKPFDDLQNTPKIALVKGSMLLVIDDESGDTESSATLSANGLELELTKVDNKAAAVVSTGSGGVDLVLAITDQAPRVINFQLPGNTKNISVVDKLGGQAGPFVVAYDGLDTLSIVNLLDVNAPVKTIKTTGDKISKIDYVGRFTVNGMITDVLIGAAQRGVVLFDLNNLTNIPVNDALKIKNKIEDLLVIDGIAYLALGADGISALSVGALIDSKDTTPATIATFKKNKLTTIKSNGKEEILTKTLNANKLAGSKPFLLSSGLDNNLTIIRVSP